MIAQSLFSHDTARAGGIIVLLGLLSSCLEPRTGKHDALPIRWTEKIVLTSIGDIDKQLDMPVSLGKQNDKAGHKLELTFETDDGKTIHKPIRTGREYLEGIRAGGYAASTYDMTMESFFTYSAGALAWLAHARPAARSLVADYKLSTNTPAELPTATEPHMEGYVEWLASVKGKTGWTVPYKILSVSPTSLVLEAEGERLHYDIAAWADFNHDAFEDVMLQQTMHYIQGTGRSYSHIFLTRTDEDGPLRLLEMPAVRQLK